MKARKLWVLPAAALLFAGVLAESRAGSLVIPEGTRVIEEEAFAGCRGMESVTLPEGLITIGARAFAETEVYDVTIPGSVEGIAADAFEGVDTPVMIRTAAGSEAARYALAGTLDFDAGTTCRALLVGQKDYPSPDQLTGPGKDVAKISAAYEDRFAVTTRMNLTGEEILSEIATVFSGAKEEDISLFFYSGHGIESSDSEYNGALLGIEGTDCVTATMLRNALDAIPGRKIVLIDACMSGAMIGKSAKLRGTAGDKASAVSSEAEEAPAVSFLRAFAGMRKRGVNLATSPYYVMVSSLQTEESWENASGGLFTTAFTGSKTSGDANGDGIVTMQESYSYTKAWVADYMTGKEVTQTVAAYPEGCYWFRMFR